MMFYVGTSPRDAYMLPDGCNVMLNARQFYSNGLPRSGRRPTAYRRFRVFLDCGGFVFFNEYGRFPFGVRDYVAFVAHLNPDLFATTDYPCEPSITSELNDWPVQKRLEVTVENAAAILAYFPAAGIGPQPVPVIQGWTAADYRACLDMHAAAGTIRPYMAVGSMCTRSDADEIAGLVRDVHAHAAGLGVERLHFFGLKRSEKLREVDHLIYSRDSAAVYFAPNRKIRREWGGSYFAPNRAAKRAAVRWWLNALEKRGLQWRVA